MEEKRKLAVTPKGFDDIGTVLEGMGYEYTPIKWRNLRDIERLRQFEVVFINCSLKGELLYAEGAKTALRQFVEMGGSLYASDWAYRFVQSAFPERISFSERGGDAQKVVATVMDAGLAEVIGNSLELHFDLGSWKPIERAGNDIRIYLRGTYFAGGKREDDKPLLVSFDCGDGHVVYTTFHNEPQLSEKERLLLKFLVLKPITSKVAIGTRRLLMTQRFSAEKENIGTINQGEASPIYSYFVPDGMNLKFMLSWQESGTNLSFSLYDPDNKLYQQKSSDTSPIILTTLLAKQGNWQYQVKGIKVPYPNFPYVLTIGSQPAGGTEQALSPQQKYCRSCGSLNRGTAKFCARCGHRFSE